MKAADAGMMLIKDGVYSNQSQHRHNRTFHGAVTSRSDKSEDNIRNHGKLPINAYDTQGQMSVREFITASFNDNRS